MYCHITGDHLCPEMKVVTKMADLTKFRQLTWRFLCKFDQQRWAWRWRIWRFRRFLCKLRVGEFDDHKRCWRIWRFDRFLLHHEWRSSRKIFFLRSLNVLPKRSLSSIMRVAPGGTESNTHIYISLALYFLRSVSVLPNRIPRYKACYPCVTESQVYLPISKACFSSGTESNVSLSFRSF